MNIPSTPQQRYLGPIKLVPGTTPGQVGLFVLVLLVCTSIIAFMPMMQALVFSELLHVPKAEHGRLAGNLVTTQQIAVLICVGLAGSLADRFGRKRVLLTALVGYAVVLFVYPLASSVLMLFAFQFVFGILSTGNIAGASTLIADYPDNASRGKFVAAMVLAQAAASAVLVGWVGARLPAWLVGTGALPADAGRYAFWGAAAVAVGAASIAMVWLKNPPRAIPAAPKAPAAVVDKGLRAAWLNVKRVVAYGRKNPRFGLVMTMGIVIRSDYFVMLSFVSLWVINASTAQGMSSVEALKTAGLLLLTFKLATAGAQLLFGFVADMIERSKLLIAALVLTGLSLVSTALISDVHGLGMFIVVAAIGITESALIVCGQSMLGEEAPVELRGSALGIFYFAGTLGVILMSFIAGFLFDKIGYCAPFVMVGLLNLLFAVVGAVLILRHRGEVESSLTPSLRRAA